jgi:hypothetical protein
MRELVPAAHSTNVRIEPSPTNSSIGDTPLSIGKRPNVSISSWMPLCGSIRPTYKNTNPVALKPRSPRIIERRKSLIPSTWSEMDTTFTVIIAMVIRSFATP